MAQLSDQQLLAAWLNFANGAFGWNGLADTTGNGVPDSSFSVAITAAEAVRANPSSTRRSQEALVEARRRVDAGWRLSGSWDFHGLLLRLPGEQGLEEFESPPPAPREARR
jgi:hypothetical protein